MLMRWLSAVGGLILLFGTLFVAGSTGLAVLGSIIVFIAAFEFASLFEQRTPWFYLFLALDILVFNTHIFRPENTLPVILMVFLIVSVAGIIFFRKTDPRFIFAKIGWPLWGTIYTALFPALTVRLLLTTGWVPVIYLLVAVFFGDVSAFFCGRYIGGPKIFPHVSPKKTISGAIGGLIASGVFGAAYLYHFTPNLPVLAALLMSTAIGFFAQFGDFFESLIKRVSGCKDSGQLMPGHGGFLDRLDGVYFGSVVFYVFLITLDYISYF